MSRRRILLAGGGTAGHVFPSLAVAHELERQADVEPVFVGTEDRLEGRLVPAAGYRLHHIDVLPLPRRPTPALFKVPGALWRSVKRCEEIARQEDVVAAATFGGYVSLPLAWATGRANLPLAIHEQNSVPGLANRVAARWADRIAVTFPGSADRFRHPELVAVTGNPVREEILDLDLDARRPSAIDAFGLRHDRRTVLVFGGSQGARSLNQAIVATQGLWQNADQIQILHAAGRDLYRETAAAWEQARAGNGGGPAVRVVDFIEDMAAAFAAADVVVCRAGATSIAELTVLGKPAVLVPYPHATHDHQLHNARALARAGGATVIEDRELDGRRLTDAVEPWLVDDDARRRVAAASLAFGRRDAAANVARLILELAPSAPRHDPPTARGDHRD